MAAGSRRRPSALGVAPHRVLAIANVLALGGASRSGRRRMMMQMAASNTLIQAMVPDALRGRVMAVYSMMFMGMAPFGALFAGVFADRLGAPRTVAFGGVICIIAATVFWLQLPSIRGEGRALLDAQGHRV